MDKIVDFFKDICMYNKEIFDYIEKNSITILDDNKIADFVGCYQTVTDGVLKKISIMIPVPKDLKTTLMVIHEYGHAISLYKFLDKKFEVSKYDEVIPIFLEKKFIKRNPELKEEYKNIDEINRSNIDNIKDEEIKERYETAYQLIDEIFEFNEEKNKLNVKKYDII